MVTNSKPICTISCPQDADQQISEVFTIHIEHPLSPFALAHEFIGYGVSSLNPSSYSNNCASVVIAKHLQYADVHHLWKALYGHDLPDIPLQLWQIEDMIHRAGWGFRKNIYVSDQHRCAYKKLRDSKPFDSGFICAAAYLIDGVGHVVVAQSPDFGSQFMCYQDSTEGIDRTDEVKKADSIVIFHLKCPQDSPPFYQWLDRAYWTMREKRKKKDWNLELRILESLEASVQDSIYEDIRDFEAYVDDVIASPGISTEPAQVLSLKLAKE